MAFAYCIRHPYVIHQSHLKLLRIILDYTGTVAKAAIILYVGTLAVEWKKISSFFYMNTFIVLVINIFYQSSNHKDLLKVKVTGYFLFIVISCAVVLWGCTFGVHWIYWRPTGTDPWVASQKREFLYKAYIVKPSYFRNLSPSC